jgi:hypothetical protein
MKLLAPRPHGYIDYVAVIALALAPTLFGFAGAPATICYVLAVVQLAMSLLTAYPLGLVKLIPFPVHGGVELVTALFLVAAPWIFRFNQVDAARNFFVASAIALLLVYLVTNYRAGDESRTGKGLHPQQSA